MTRSNSKNSSQRNRDLHPICEGHRGNIGSRWVRRLGRESTNVNMR
jgi:hypothetical protein